MALKKRVYALFSAIRVHNEWRDEVIAIYSNHDHAMDDCKYMRKQNRSIHYWVEGFDLCSSKQWPKEEKDG